VCIALHVHMTVEEYRSYYIRFLVTIIGPSVNREVHNDPALASDSALQADLENKTTGLMVLSLVSLIEANFLSKQDMRALRSFTAPPTPLPASVKLDHLAGCIYLRDCVAHNPNGALLPPGQNTTAFSAAVAGQTFPWAAIQGQAISISPQVIHELHLNVLRFFGEHV
jgi:hypothetical protein